ncbi:MAG: VanW family protein [Christensenellaceae bacterium]|nr:VanW family protein [Christensenellaceae bacterium]
MYSTKKLFTLILCVLLVFSTFNTNFVKASEMSNEEILALDETEAVTKNPDGVDPLVAYARKEYKTRGYNIPQIAPSSLNAYEAIYTATMRISASLRNMTDEDKATKTKQVPEGAKLTIYEILPNWALVDYNGHIGYLLRSYLNEGSITPIDIVNTPPYGVTKPKFVGKLTETALIYNEPKADAVPFMIPVTTGADLAILDFVDGYAKVLVWRNYGYIDAKLIKDVMLVSPTDTPLSEDTPIAAFCSFYEHSYGSESNDSRCLNIEVSTKYMTTVMQPGESFDFNAQVGPYKRSKGYEAAPVLINGTTQLGYGGGTCQSSSTMYNALVQLPKLAILHRRPHGPNSAKYLPIHQDAAVGNNALNLIFRNDYDFPISIKATAVKGCLFIAIYKN